MRTKLLKMRFLRLQIFQPLFAAYLLLPVLFQTLLGFQSTIRAGWEMLYLAAAIAATIWLQLVDREKRGGVWRPFYAVAAGVSALICQNLLLGVGLFALAVSFCVGGQTPFILQFLAGTAVFLFGGLLSLSLLLHALLGDVGQLQFEAYISGNCARTYATVTVTDPGAMGRVRYHATEQYELISLGSLARVSVVTGRSSGTADSGRYNYIIDSYFNQR